MRQVLLGDIVSVARVLLAQPRGDWQTCLQTLVGQAHCAHHVSKRLKRPHERWGNGSLSSAALGWPQCREPFCSDPRYLEALLVIAQSLLQRHGKFR